jgi:hypothetical protein
MVSPSAWPTLNSARASRPIACTHRYDKKNNVRPLPLFFVLLKLSTTVQGYLLRFYVSTSVVNE